MGRVNSPTYFNKGDGNMFATLEKAKQYLDITINDYDDMIALYIKASTKIVKNYIHRHIEYRDVLYSTSGNDMQLLKVNTYPIKSIVSVIVAGEDVSSECSIDTDSYVYIYRENGFQKNYNKRPFDLLDNSLVYPKRDITLNIIGGYILPTEESSDFPEDIQIVVLNLVKLMFQNSSIEKSISNENYKSSNFSFSKEYQDEVKVIRLSKFDKEVLNKYKEVK
jgi:hypothetical protein